MNNLELFFQIISSCLNQFDTNNIHSKFCKGNITLCGMWCGKTRVTNHELRVASWKLKCTSWNSIVRATSLNPRSQIHELGVQIHEFTRSNHELFVQICEFKKQSNENSSKQPDELFGVWTYLSEQT